MGENTAISWCHHTFNAWWGCFKISPGCANCYAATFDKRVGGKNWERTGPRRFFGEKHWKEPLKWAAKARAAGVRERVFCSSMADVLERHPDPEVNRQMDERRRRLGDLIRTTADALDWLLLTKRIENRAELDMITSGEVLPNLWLGSTVEDQEHAEKRIPILLKTPAAVRFLSCEPLLGHLAIARWMRRNSQAPDVWMPPLDWVIAGCESGPGARACSVEWLRSLRDQCAEAGVSYFLKQAEESTDCSPGRIVDIGDDDPLAFGEGSKLKGRRPGGRHIIELPYLDGVQHAAFPEVRHG